MRQKLVVKRVIEHKGFKWFLICEEIKQPFGKYTRSSCDVQTFHKNSLFH